MDHAQLNLFVFDLDGTLVDSRLDITRSVNLAMAHHSLPQLAETIVGSHVGTGIRPLLQIVANQHWGEDSAKRYAALVETFEGFYSKHLADSTRLYPGMGEVLDFLDGKPVVVLTNKRQVFADALLDKIGLTGRFARIHGREAFPRAKPDPLPLIEICRGFQCSPANALMVGDTDVDILCGKAAGTRTCAAAYGYGDAGKLAASGADFAVRSPGELLTRLTALAGGKQP